MAHTDLIAALLTLALAIPAVGWLVLDSRQDFAEEETAETDY